MLETKEIWLSAVWMQPLQKRVCVYVCVDEFPQWIAKVPSTILLRVSSLSSPPNSSFHLLPLKMSSLACFSQVLSSECSSFFSPSFASSSYDPLPKSHFFSNFFLFFFLLLTADHESLSCFSCFSLGITNKLCNRSFCHTYTEWDHFHVFLKGSQTWRWVWGQLFLWRCIVIPPSSRQLSCAKQATSPSTQYKCDQGK